MEVFQLLRSILRFNPHPTSRLGSVIEVLGLEVRSDVSILAQPIGWVQFLYLVFLSAHCESLTCKSSYHEYALHHQGAGEVNHIASAVLLDPLVPVVRKFVKSDAVLGMWTNSPRPALWLGCRLSFQSC